MISEKLYLLEVSKTKANIDLFVNEALTDTGFRELVVYHLMNNKSINVYYHSYHIINKVSLINPLHVYEFWNNFVKLLSHNNSYHRGYGMNLLANLITVDNDNKFNDIIDLFFKQLYDEKISNRKSCITNSHRILKNKSDLIETVIPKIVESLRFNSNSDKHQNYLISEFIKLLSEFKPKITRLKSVKSFLNDVLNESASDKVKREINKLLK